MKKFAAVVAGAITLGAASMASAATWTYVGQWNVGDGPNWGSNPLAYSGVGAAALLFGGSASDYAISTIDSDPNHINNMANYAIIGIGFQTFAQDYFRGVEGVTHYQDVYDYDAQTDTVSAYVNDFGAGGANYAFRIDEGSAVPEPATWGLMIMGFGAAGAVLRRRRLAVAA